MSVGGMGEARNGGEGRELFAASLRCYESALRGLDDCLQGLPATDKSVAAQTAQVIWPRPNAPGGPCRGLSPITKRHCAGSTRTCGVRLSMTGHWRRFCGGFCMRGCR